MWHLGAVWGYSWGSLHLTVANLLFWHRCCPSHHEYVLRAWRGNRICFHRGKDNANTYSNWEYYIICSNLTFWIYCWLSALHSPSWRSTSSISLILWHLASTDDITLTDSAAQVDLITCWTRAVDLITRLYEATPRLLIGCVWGQINSRKYWNILPSEICGRFHTVAKK